MSDTPKIIAQLEILIEQVRHLLPPAHQPITQFNHHAYRWRQNQQGGGLETILNPASAQLVNLQCVDKQKTQLDRNTRQFVKGLPANNALLWGARGTGKSSLVKALVNQYKNQGLKIIEVEKQHLTALPDVIMQIWKQPERFIIFCDDLSFEPNDANHKAIKVVLDGSICDLPDNMLIYATSNRRHLMPEYMEENRHSGVNIELHPGETAEEKLSLSERFGLWVPFHPFSQDQYLQIVQYWLATLGCLELDTDTRSQALEWALRRGGRSGRGAKQFALDYVGRQRLEAGKNG